MSDDTRLATDAWEALFRAQATVHRELVEANTRAELLPAEYGVLYALSRAPQGLRGTELIADILLSQAGTSRLTARLEDRGLITRSDDPDDARACRFHLTHRGRTLQRRVGTEHARHVVAAMTRTLDGNELATLRDLCSRLADIPLVGDPEDVR
jgi:DNA-binding MarR family transcriptional regulator